MNNYIYMYIYVYIHVCIIYMYVYICATRAMRTAAWMRQWVVSLACTYIYTHVCFVARHIVKYMCIFTYIITFVNSRKFRNSVDLAMCCKSRTHFACTTYMYICIYTYTSISKIQSFVHEVMSCEPRIHVGCRYTYMCIYIHIRHYRFWKSRNSVDEAIGGKPRTHVAWRIYIYIHTHTPVSISEIQKVCRRGNEL